MLILSKRVVGRANVWRKLLLNHGASHSFVIPQLSYSGLAVSLQNKYLFNHSSSWRLDTSCSLLAIHRKWCSKGLIDNKGSDLTVRHGKVTKNILELFPQPRVTLNELTSKTPDKIFDIHYKQNTVAPKGRNKGLQHNDWTCTYSFVWPEKAKFEGTAISKRQAAEKAATQAIRWLYIKRRIDSKGQPIYDQNVLENIRSTLNEPIHISISEKSMERVEKIWNEYQDGIKDIYEATFKEAKERIVQTAAVLTKDSTIDEDEFSENEENLEPISDIDLEIKQQVHPVYCRKITKPTATALERRNRVLNKKFEQYDEEITPLPIDEYSEQIKSALENNNVTIIVGAAGCGKSTRAPAAILRHCGADAAVIVSEPRRVAAIGLAERVASELGEEVGESVGYQVRLHSKLPKPPAGSILYCTSGVLLRRLQTNPGLEGCTHVIIDEAHERDVNTDITLLLLKRATHINPKLKIVIMSATLHVDVFTKYFETCPVIEVPGRTFPVVISYLEDIQNKFNLRLPQSMENSRKESRRPQVNCHEVAEVIKCLDKHEKEGAILVFLPGWSEIKQTKQLLDEYYKDSTLHMILPVHSRLSTSDQSKMFATPSRGIRKIVLATNIAETSITIPDVVYVLDTGAHKENTIKEGTGTSSLETVWVSLAGAKQRTGRAGRIQPGHCYRLYTKEKEYEFSPHTTPEILRIPLVQTVLDCKTYAPNELVSSFLSQLLEPPSEKAVQFAVNDLIELGALSPQEQLTRLGQLLSTLTVHPRIGRSLLHSAIIGNIVAAANMAVHCSNSTEIFANATERRDEIREIKRSYSPTSDHVALFGIQDDFERILQEGGREASDKFCEKYGLRGERLAFVRSLTNLHLSQVLSSTMIAPTTEAEELNRFTDIHELLPGVLLSGADALLYTRKRIKLKGKMNTIVEVVTSNGDRAHIGTESVNKHITKLNRSSVLSYFGGHQSLERSALLVYCTSVVTHHCVVLFAVGDPYIEEDGDTTIISLPKHRLEVHMPTSQAHCLLKVREMLWKTLNYYIERDIQTLRYDDNVNVGRFKVRLMKTVGRILVEAHRECIEGKPVFEELEDAR